MTVNQNISGGHQLASDSEVAILDVVNFLRKSWRQLSAATAAGVFLGFSGWFFLLNYNAELVLSNNNGAIDLIGWRGLQSNLPGLARQIVAEGKAPRGQEALYQTLADPVWWQKDVKINFGITKAESKELASIVGLESAGASIISLTLNMGGPSKAKAIENVYVAKDFMLEGASYLAVKSLFNSQESELMMMDADIRKKISAKQIELGYQLERLKSLEVLAKRFPGEQKAISQVVDPKDSGAKYLSISTQIIAANTDINFTKESLERLRDQQAQISLLQAWITQASPIIDKSYNGIEITDELLEQEAKFRAKVSSSDPKVSIFFDDLHSSLIANKVRFAKNFEVTTAPTAAKKGLIKMVAGVTVCTFFLMLLTLLGQLMWRSIKASDNS